MGVNVEALRNAPMKRFQAILFAIGLGIFLSFPLTAIAANSTLSNTHFPMNSSTKTTIDNFLTSIPEGYYTLKNISDLKKKMNDKSVFLIDVREPSEYQSSHIPEAVNIPIRELSQHLDEIPQDRSVLLYCTTGYRTAMGVMALQMLGYDNVQGFPPSFKGWQEAGEPVVSSAS
ncbi:MAG: rhodanese-like domain-containing protein [Halothece sp.]